MTKRAFKADSAVVQIGRLLYAQRVAEARAERAALKAGFRPTKRSRKRVSLPRW